MNVDTVAGDTAPSAAVPAPRVSLSGDSAHTVAGLVAALEAEFSEEAAPAAERVQKWLQRMLELGLLRLVSGK